MTSQHSECKRVAIYARVSTESQTTDNQLVDLRRYCIERGWTIAGEFTDNGISGTVASRPSLDRLMEAVRKRKGIDGVLVWRFYRFARSVKHLVGALVEFRGLGVQFISFQENIDTGSPLGAAIFTIIAAMAALERDIIVDRVKAGLRRASCAGTKLGRPVAAFDVARAAALRSSGLSIRAIAKELNQPKSVIERALKSGTVLVPNTH